MNSASITPSPSIIDFGLYDFSWEVNSRAMYKAVTEQIPQILSWSDSANVLASLKALDRATSERRWVSALDHVARYDAALAKKMRGCFSSMSPDGRLRFVTAPETIYRISRLRGAPKMSITHLCGFLNGELAFEDPQATTSKPHWTALGDFRSAVSSGTEAGGGSYRAPQFAEGVPIDFYSPNRDCARETGPQADHLDYSDDETQQIHERLAEAYGQICAVSPCAGELVRKFTKVVIAFKEPDHGTSTSQCDFPGRVLLGGVELSSPVRLASSLVHESIHQLLYILEYQGGFVVDFPRQEENITIKSAWSGRNLDVYAYIHACFVWYGLSCFWARAASSAAFEAEAVQKELSACAAGLREGNPLDRFGDHAGFIRFDTMRAARSLQPRLLSLIN